MLTKIGCMLNSTALNLNHLHLTHSIQGTLYTAFKTMKNIKSNNYLAIVDRHAEWTADSTELSNKVRSHTGMYISPHTFPIKAI